MITSRKRLDFVWIVLLNVLAFALPVHAQDYFKGKTFTIVAGFSPAGGYDRYARNLQRYLGNHIPGKPLVIVQNMPGAGSLTSVRYLDLTAPKDGTVMTIFNPGLVTQSVVQPERVRVDFRKIAWVGIVTPDYRVCYGYGAKGIASWDQLMHGGKQFIIGSTGKGSGNYINGATLRMVFRAPVKQVLGFPGSAEQRLAIEQGELDGDCGSYSSIPPEWIKKGQIHAFVRFSRDRPPEVPESAPYIGTFAANDQQQLLRLLNGGDEVGRPFIMSKQVPAERLAIVRRAFDDTMKDPGFLAEMAKEELPVHPLTGEQAEKIVNELVSAPASVVAAAKPIYE